MLVCQSLLDLQRALHRIMKGGVDLNVIHAVCMHPLNLIPCDADRSIPTCTLSTLQYLKRAEHANEEDG